MIEKNCLICGTKFFTHPCKIKDGKGKYCSKSCYYESLKGGKHTEEHKKKISESNKGSTNWKKRINYKHSEETKRKIGKANSIALKGKYTGNKSMRWNGGKVIVHGYIFIHTPNHPFVTNRGYVREHRLIAEKCLGRYLEPKEVIHHINEIKDDNRPENLYLFATTGKHTKFHQLKIKIKLISNLPHIAT